MRADFTSFRVPRFPGKFLGDPKSDHKTNPFNFEDKENPLSYEFYVPPVLNFIELPQKMEPRVRFSSTEFSPPPQKKPLPTTEATPNSKIYTPKSLTTSRRSSTSTLPLIPEGQDLSCSSSPTRSPHRTSLDHTDGRAFKEKIIVRSEAAGDPASSRNVEVSVTYRRGSVGSGAERSHNYEYGPERILGGRKAPPRDLAVRWEVRR